MKNILEIKNITKKIGKIKILDDISFEVKQGEIFGFVGKNGAGKSTLIKVMLGLYKASKGSILIDGIDIKKDFEKAVSKVGAIIETPEMYEYLRGKDNLKLVTRILNNKDLKYQNKIIKDLSLEKVLNKKVKTYSLGTKQRLGIAQALITKPKLLVLDEPTNGLDPIGIKNLRELLKKISKENNIAVFISSHLLSEIELICDRVAIIDKGKIIEIKDIKSINKNQTILFEVDNIKKASKVLEKERLLFKIKNNNIETIISKEMIPKINNLLVRNNIQVYKINNNTLEDELMEKLNKEVK